MKALILSLVFVATTVACLSQTAQTLPAWTKEVASVKKVEKKDKIFIMTCTYISKTVYKNGELMSNGEFSQEEADKIANQHGYQSHRTIRYGYEIGDSFSHNTKGNRVVYQKREVILYCFLIK